MARTTSKHAFWFGSYPKVLRNPRQREGKERPGPPPTRISRHPRRQRSAHLPQSVAQSSRAKRPEQATGAAHTGGASVREVDRNRGPPSTATSLPVHLRQRHGSGSESPSLRSEEIVWMSGRSPTEDLYSTPPPSRQIGACTPLGCTHTEFGSAPRNRQRDTRSTTHGEHAPCVIGSTANPVPYTGPVGGQPTLLGDREHHQSGSKNQRS